MKLEIRKIGNSTGLILPRDALAQLGLKLGDVVFAVADGDGGLRLTPLRSGVRGEHAARRRNHRQYKDTLKELAK